MRKRVKCPFCEGDGCCFCDHEGTIYVGEKELIKSEAALNSIGVQYLKEEDPGETWPEMWVHFLDEKNVPDYFKRKIMKNQNKLDQLAAELGNAVYHKSERYICFNAGRPQQPHTAIIETDHFRGETLTISGSTPGCPVYKTPHVAEAFAHIRRLN